MKIRHCVRAVMFDENGRLLLFRYKAEPQIRGKNTPEMTHYWGTVGGGIDAGEDDGTALRREILEETGFTDVDIGPCVWHRKCDLSFFGTPVHIDEKYFVAHTRAQEMDFSRHTEIERKYVEDVRWWTVADILASDDIMYPLNIRDLIADIAAGQYPAVPVLIED